MRNLRHETQGMTRDAQDNLSPGHDHDSRTSTRVVFDRKVSQQPANQGHPRGLQQHHPELPCW